MTKNIIGYRIFPKEEMFKNNIYVKLRESYPSGVIIKCIDCKSEAVLNGYKAYVEELDVDFNKDRLILVLEGKNKK